MNIPTQPTTRSGTVLPPPKVQRRRLVGESIIEGVLLLSAMSAVFITISIIVVLVSESFEFFRHVSLIDFVTEPTG
mgnify:CR=1 FL=1